MQPTPKITGKTKFLGGFADPIDHVQASTVLNSIFVERGIDAVSIGFHVKSEHLAEVVAGLKHVRNFCGFGATIPHKTAIASFCDELLPNALASGVVNLIQVAPDGRWIGETFDGIGMVRAIQKQRELGANTGVLQIGAGGAGCSVAVALALEGVGNLTIVNRTQSKADDLAETVRKAAPDCLVETGRDFDLSSFDIAVNTTSLGMNAEGPSPLDVSKLPKTALVAEAVMVPKMTPLLESAKALNLAFVTGREMLDEILEVGLDFLLQGVTD